MNWDLTDQIDGTTIDSALSVGWRDAPESLIVSEQAFESLLESKNTARHAKIMVVDDEPINFRIVQKYMKQAGYDQFVTTCDSREALTLIRNERPDVVLLDLKMPHVTGLHILEALRGDCNLHYLPVLILTASGDEDSKRRAFELGATDFLTKPVDPVELQLRVRNALVVKAHHDHLVEYSARLACEVQHRTTELAQSRLELLHVLACAAEYRDQDTGNHVVRVGRYVGIIAQALGFSPTRVALLEQAAVLHDVGKIAIPDSILRKPGKLNEEELVVIRKHCEYGTNILRCVPVDGNLKACIVGRMMASRSPILRTAATIALSHHEKWDGSGYPQGLAGEAIPIEGRITAAADVFDALNSRRPYKDAMPADACFSVLEKDRGRHFDPQVLDAMFSRTDKILQVAVELADSG